MVSPEVTKQAKADRLMATAVNTMTTVVAATREQVVDAFTYALVKAVEQYMLTAEDAAAINMLAIQRFEENR